MNGKNYKKPTTNKKKFKKRTRWEEKSKFMYLILKNYYWKLLSEIRKILMINIVIQLLSAKQKKTMKFEKNKMTQKKSNKIKKNWRTSIAKT